MATDPGRQARRALKLLLIAPFLPHDERQARTLALGLAGLSATIRRIERLYNTFASIIPAWWHSLAGLACQAQFYDRE